MKTTMLAWAGIILTGTFLYSAIFSKSKCRARTFSKNKSKFLRDNGEPIEITEKKARLKIPGYYEEPIQKRKKYSFATLRESQIFL